jgi:beta-galactosidase
MDDLVGELLVQTGVTPPLVAPRGVEVVQREGDGRSLLFLLNHGDQQATVDLDGNYHDLLTNDERAGKLTVEPFGVVVLEAR